MAMLEHFYGYDVPLLLQGVMIASQEIVARTFRHRKVEFPENDCFYSLGWRVFQRPGGHPSKCDTYYI